MISGAIGYFLVTIALTLVITVFAARHSHGRASFYAASARITAGQNGLAIAGDFMSASTLLGITGLYFMGGLDATLYYVSAIVGMCLLLVLIAGPLRRLGRFTLGDVVEARLKDRRVRIFSGISTIVISLFYLVSQLVGAGTLISLLFGLSFLNAVLIVGALMTTYVVFGGMLAATWVQIVKAALLMAAVLGLAVLCVYRADGLGGLYERAAAAHSLGAGLFAFGGAKHDLFSSLSLCCALVLGTLGLPHILIRFFTVADAEKARRSVVIATWIIGAVFIVLFLIIGPASVAFVLGVAKFAGADGTVLGGSNMVVVHLANAVGGDLLAGMVSAVAFATILAVVAGLTITIATAGSHDLYVALCPVDQRDEKHELVVFRVAAFATSAVAIALALLFQHENIGFMIALTFSVAASATFPVLISVLYWPGLTATGALTGGISGLVLSVVLIAIGPAFWVKILGFAEPIFPSEYPALVSVPIAFAVTWIASTLTRGKETPGEAVTQV